ncbi:cytochrome c biogenesis protein ResB [Microlunatus kandeliicorticis]
MRTALVLLFALAVAAIPGSVIPQRKISPIAVDDFISQHRTLGPLYDKVGLFAVYSSPWFSAVYLLLFVSLIGCIVPRVLTYARAVRAKPVRTPRNLGRLPVAESWESADEASVVLDRAEAELRRRRYRVARRTDAGGESVSAERGYLREAGNLVFHLSLLFVLLGVAINGLTQFRGSSVVVVGQGFSNSLSQYDDFSAGGLFSERQLVPFSLQLTDFQVRFETGPVQTGAARLFKATLKVTDAPGEPARTETLEVNHPLNIDGTDVHLIGHGYAPVVTVKDAQGNVAFSGPVVFLPQDGNFTSSGVIKVPDARPERLAFQGLFLPTGAMTPAGPQSVFPDLLQPQLLLNAWEGKPQADTGVPESVYTLDTSGLTQVRDPKNPNQPFRFLLRPGYEQKLPNGLGTIQLTGVQRWVKLQVGDSPGVGVALVAIGTGVLGLCFSLFVRPRRVWIRVRPAASVGGPDPNHPEDGDATGAAADPAATREGRRTVVDVGALDRADARTGLAEDVAELATTLGRPATTQKDV